MNKIDMKSGKDTRIAAYTIPMGVVRIMGPGLV